MTTRAPNFGPFHIRKWFAFAEETLAGEMGKAADGASLFKYVIAAAIHNPYAGDYVEDLGAWIDASPALGVEIGRRLNELSGGAAIESYGKAILVGTDGEYEHGNALLTNPAANPVRDAVGGGKSWVPSTGKRGVPGTVLDIPLAHKDALYVRSHYDTVSVSFNDAPNRDEVLVIWAFATRGRLNARLGGLKASEVKGEDGLV
ncbi:amino acid synthesis family protein [Sphingomonas pokkalii]|uniref:Peptide synthetase n=1 Tax=Sphingomonas pokkalii TaxID=2175090 RepID=A0A2U0SHJ4_9SPHN|nr:amino acid synthesis family protein [Sphingomonas pokkalii]PVX30823.1 peptide synthetase [Sphingomonas pokkalii]